MVHADPLCNQSRSFILPIIYNITEHSDDDEGNDPDELISTGVGTMRKKDVNEGKDYGVEDGVVKRGVEANGVGVGVGVGGDVDGG